jgi:hypothetical protein
VVVKPGARNFSLSYGGEIHHPVAEQGQEYARSFGVSPGIIGPEGVFLSGSSYWVSRIEDLPTLVFEMTVSLPEGWRSVSQGQRVNRVEQDSRIREAWKEVSPQEEVYLIAARFTEYRRPEIRHGFRMLVLAIILHGTYNGLALLYEMAGLAP